MLRPPKQQNLEIQLLSTVSRLHELATIEVHCLSCDRGAASGVLQNSQETVQAKPDSKVICQPHRKEAPPFAKAKHPPAVPNTGGLYRHVPGEDGCETEALKAIG